MGCPLFRATALFFLAITGCAARQPLLAAAQSTGAPPVPEAPVAVTARSQKPDNSSNRSPIRQTVFEAAPETFSNLPGGKVAVRIRAHVNGVPILDEEVRDACYPFLIGTLSLPEPERSHQQAEIFRNELQQIIDREVVLQDAFSKLAKSGPQYLDKLKAAAGKDFDRMVRTMKTRAQCKTDDELKDLLRKQGQSLEGIKRQVVFNFMAREYMRSRIYPAIERVGHQEIVEYYQDHAPEFQTVDLVKWQDIFIDSSKYKSHEEGKRFAQQLAERARKGEDFGKLAKFDNGDSSYRGGEGFGQKRGEIKPPQAEPILFKMKDGEIGPVIELPTGFHVIRLAERTYAGLLPLNEKTQGEIRKKLQGQVAEKETKRMLFELKQKATIEIAP